MSDQKFLTIEGGEGAGKSSLQNFLANALTQRNLDVVTTREPGGSFLGEEIRDLVLSTRDDEPITPLAELLLFLAARAQHIDTLIRPSLAQNKVVICDRFTDSTLAYQAVARGIAPDTVQQFATLTEQHTHPSLTLYLDVPPEIGIKRAHKRNNHKGMTTDRIEEESLEFHQKVRQGFRHIAQQNPERIKILDTTKPLAQVQQQALTLVTQWLTTC